MGKVVALILLAVSTKVNAEEELTNNLADRALNNILLHADLDDAMLAKPVMASGGVMSPMTASRVLVVPCARDYNARDPKTGKKLFGGTNQLLAGQGKACTDYDQAITSFGWFGAVGGAKDRQKATKQQKAKVAATKDGKRVFGGTNKLLAGLGQAATQYDNPITSFGWFGAVGGAKARSSDNTRRR